MNEIWSKSIREEIIGCLWLIAAFVGKPHIHEYYYYFMLFMAVTSLIPAMIYAYYEIKIKKLKKKGDKAAC